MSPRNAAVLTAVSVFWISLPVSSPWTFATVSTTMDAMATSCWDERLIA
jgi:hypothetical protein